MFVNASCKVGVMILTMKSMVVNNTNVFVNSLAITTIYCPVVEKLTTGNCTWSLILLTTEPITTMDDHIFVVVKNF